MDLTASVVIVGSGMGGATTALALTRAGVDVIVLERGDFLPSEIQNWSPEEVFLNRRYKPHEEWLDGNGTAFAPGVHYVVGGNTKLYGASLPRFRESDFNAVDHLEGCSSAWPFSYQDLEPYYCAAENIFRVHGTTGEDPTEPWRSQSFPFPAVPHEPYISEMAERLRGQNVHPSSNAMGIDLALGGTCIRCQTCDGFPCRIGAKSDAETCAIAPALATGNLHLITSAKVVRIVAKANRVTHLVVETPDGLVRVGGGKFVISAGAVNSAALLLASRSEDFPSGLGNGSDQVGRNFMMHNNAHIAAVDVNRLNDVVFQKTISINDWYHDGGNGYPLGALQLIGKVQGAMMKSWATKVPLSLLNQIAKHSVEWLVMAEDLPHPENRVTLSSDNQITTARIPIGLKTHQKLRQRAKTLFHDAGYDVVFTQKFDISMNSHQCGTLVAGEDPARSVLDPMCKFHDLANLWAIDGGFFPSSAAMNPALTIAAQALRVVAESDIAK